MRGFTNREKTAAWLVLFLFWLLSAPGCNNRPKNTTPSGSTETPSSEGTGPTSSTPTEGIDPDSSTQMKTPTENTGPDCAALTESEQNKLNEELHSAVSGTALVSGGTGEIVRELLAKCADPNARFPDAYLSLTSFKGATSTALEKAALIGSSDIAKILLSGGADPNATDNYGWTVLHRLAFLSASPDYMVKILISHGANPDMPDKIGYVPLHLAIRHNKINIVRELLKGGANPNVPVPGEDGTKPLEWAQYLGKSSLIISSLKKAGAE